VVELSELEALTDLDHHLAIAGRWREAGYRFAIDDFGAGYISLPFVSRLLPEYIKVDRSMILQAVSSPKFKSFLKRMMEAAGTFTSEGIVAEGVETENELRLVEQLGFPFVQGYLFGRPKEMSVESAAAAEGSRAR
jgi:EAL domain-containing protein (putative c-di-GMP-specific phosphodiesterase class I)